MVSYKILENQDEKGKFQNTTKDFDSCNVIDTCKNS